MPDRITAEAIDQPAVDAWLLEHVAGALAPFAYELIVGGRSNLTFKVTDGAAHRYVLRRPPLGPLLATAHNVVREHRLIASLAGTPVPVPRALGVCEDVAVNGAPFFVTEFVDGVVIDAADKVASLDAAAMRELSYNLVDVLAELHGVDLVATGLDDLARHEGYLDRQIRRWSKQWAASKTRELPAIDEVEQLLRRDMPEQHGAAIVHGDYRFGNCIADLQGRRIAAVLDWELCTIGDVMADLGHMCVYWYDAARPLPLTNDPTTADFPSFGELLQRYAARTGRDVSCIEYYHAFAAWRLGIIAEGVAVRHQHMYGADSAVLAASQASVARLAESALASLTGTSRT
jgi:aminoglycoside phosphotransferase (APT) family kinase protein